MDDVVYWYQEGLRPAVIVSRGKKNLQIVLQDKTGRVAVKTLKRETEKEMIPIHDTTKAKALRKFRRFYKTANRVAIYENVGGFKVIVGHRLPRMSKALRKALEGVAA